jgi:Rrf2 family iron-sulfur cluster assembly transcriptional regulator
LWADLSAQIHQFLSEIDLASIIARGEVHQLAPRQDAVQEESGQFEVLDMLSSREI